MRRPMTQAPITWTVRTDGVAEIVMESADGRNALTDTFVASLVSALNDAAAVPESRVLLLKGTSEVFCSGASKELLLRLAGGDMSPAEIDLPRRVLGAQLPLIAAMEGHAVGGGFALGLCADIILVARESRYGCNFIDLGITPGMGTTRLLEQVLPSAIANELLLSGELRRGSDFAESGGFNYLLPKTEVLPKAVDLARRIAEKPRYALETLKGSIAARRIAVFEDALTDEARMHRTVFDQPETRKRIEVEFVE